MSLVPSLVRPIVLIDGEALVLHVGDKPYVLSESGQIDLAAHDLTHETVNWVITHLLPADSQRALKELGATRHELDLPEFPGEHFSIVASRGGEDVWVEIRRRHLQDADRPRGDLSLMPRREPALESHAVDPAAEIPGVSALWSDVELAANTPHWDGDGTHAIEPARDTPPVGFIQPADGKDSVDERREAAQPAVVLPLTRNPIRRAVPPPSDEEALAGLDHLLRLAAARGASTLYLCSDARSSIRVDGEVQALEGTPILGPNDLESLLLTLMPVRNADALRTGATTEWMCDFPDLGRVRCMSFRDHRGPGGVFRIMPIRAVTSMQLGLSREVQDLAAKTEGLVLVSGQRSSGKRTLMAALVDLINRTRHAHIIAIEREINIVHEPASSFISQREAHGGPEDMLLMARAALREDPDVLVLESARTVELMTLALDAAGSGRLVICGFPAHSVTGAVDGIIDLFQPDSRRHVQVSLAQRLLGAVVQVLLNKTGGGRLAAREVLLNTSVAASVIAEGKTSQLPLVIEGGRKLGMVPLNDALAGLVQSGDVDLREAFQSANDKAGFLATLQRQGIDTTSVERFG